jgi:lipid II:glycine glycyltransferase (peptidoglycan interpeptide bridge formation enzyme)
VVPKEFRPVQTFCLHTLDLQIPTSQIFENLHRDSTQRKIRRAQRERLTYDEGRSDNLLDQFYRLLLLTRRRHRVPPQPRRWFSNLLRCLGERAKIRVVSKGGQPLASIMTLRFQDALVYKYGASDVRYHNLGAMHLCLWRAIEEAKEAGLKEFDLGRSDLEHEGLITFKDRWGAHKRTLTYYRQSIETNSFSREGWQTSSARNLRVRMPGVLLEICGRLFYRHFG